MASDLLWTMRGLVVLSTLILILIPAPATYKALRDKRVSHMAIFPLAAGFASSHMWYEQSVILSTRPPSSVPCADNGISLAPSRVFSALRCCVGFSTAISDTTYSLQS